MASHDVWIKAELDELKQKGLYRRLREMRFISSTEAFLGSKKVVAFCSNDYLGFSTESSVKAAAAAAAIKYGAGSGASRLISGTTPLHTRLENELAEFKGTHGCLVFSSGYAANVGTICALSGKSDRVFLDRLCHASIVDGVFQSRAPFRTYEHGSVSELDGLFLKKKTGKRTLVITESVFSMDGDISPLKEYLEVCRKHGAMLMIDEAHATGVLGASGRGALEHFGIQPGSVDVVMGTLSKALGSLGGFVAGSTDLIDFLKNRARSFVYSTALPPSCCAAALEALRILKSEPERVLCLRKKVRTLFSRLSDLGFKVPDHGTPIVPVIIGNEREVIRVSERLLSQGFFVPGIRYPTVPKGKARLRISISDAHTDEQIDGLINALGEALIR